MLFAIYNKRPTLPLTLAYRQSHVAVSISMPIDDCTEKNQPQEEDRYKWRSVRHTHPHIYRSLLLDRDFFSVIIDIKGARPYA